MAIYVYEYTDEDGHKQRVEQIFPIGRMPDEIEVSVGEETYIAKRVEIVRTARMKQAWDTFEPSDLPPTDWAGDE